MKLSAWAPATLLALGSLLSMGVRPQKTMPLRESLDTTVPVSIEGHVASDLEISSEEIAVAGASAYIFRSFAAPGDNSAAFSAYVGYYDRQARGRTIHSPRNCLPGSGWSALASTTVAVAVADGVVHVNRYMLQRDNERALVIYWYQGRGRVEANEYKVKADLLRDAALRRRTEEALVRVVVPIRTTEADAERLALQAATDLIPSVSRALPL